ncbi:MAG: site-specific integrase [Ferruginibacter sp.]
MENVNVFPEVNKQRVTHTGEYPLRLAVTLDGKVVTRDNLHKKLHKSQWDEKTRNVSNPLIAAVVSKRKAELDNEFTRRQLLGEKLTASLIKRIVAGPEFGGCYFKFSENMIQNKRLKDGKPYADDTKRRYMDEVNRMRQFKPTLLLSDLTPEFLVKYKEWMQNDYLKKDGFKMEKNSIWKALSFLRTVCNEAIDKGLMRRESYPFEGFEIGSCDTDPSKVKYLELKEIKAIEAVLIKMQLEPMTINIGWRFLAMCVTGMRISDSMRLDESFFNDAGYLSFTPHKTRRHGNKVLLPIVSDSQRYYLQQAIDHPIPGKNPKSFRTVFNEHLKILAAHAGIKINLTSHVGRHTMGSIMVDADIQEKPAMAMLGIKSNKTIKIYSHLKESKLVAEANKLKGFL